MYTCVPQCYAYTNGHICKHIHKVHSLSIAKQGTTPSSVKQPDPMYNDSMSEEDPFAYAEATEEHQKGTAFKLIK